MLKHEASFGLTFRSWFRANKKKFDSCVFEIKHTRGKSSFSVSEWKEEQRDHALACKSDEGNLMRFSSGTTGMPDYGFYRNAYAYIVIRFPKAFYVIDADDLNAWKLKSLKEQEANILAIHSVQL
jgi:hypothetical protein